LFSSQLQASTAFSKRLPFTYLTHALLIVLMAIALHWTRRRIRKLAEEKPDVQRALPILDLPVSTAFALSMLFIPLIYVQAPCLIHGMMGAVTLIPTAVVSAAAKRSFGRGERCLGPGENCDRMSRFLV
jgi:hypothetical protein